LRVAAVAECDIESAATDDAAATTKWRRLNLVGVDRLVLILISSIHEVGDISNVIATLRLVCFCYCNKTTGRSKDRHPLGLAVIYEIVWCVVRDSLPGSIHWKMQSGSSALEEFDDDTAAV